MIQVELVRNSRDWDAFLSFSTPVARVVLRRWLNVNANPYFKRILMRPLVARRGERVVGRVVGVLPLPAGEVVSFGFLERGDDPTVAEALLQEVSRWAGENGATVLRGPIHLDRSLESAAADSVDFETLGFKKSEDRIVYAMDAEARFSEQILAQAERLKQSGAVKLRALDSSKFEGELKHLYAAYCGAGFAEPLPWEEFRYLARWLRIFWDPELVLIAEVAGEIAGFAVAVPDVALALAGLKNGRLLPFGFFKLLWNLRGPGRRRVVSRFRVLLVAIQEQYAPMDLGPLFYATYWERAPKFGYSAAECWPISERSEHGTERSAARLQTLEALGASRKKVYRIYERALRG